MTIKLTLPVGAKIGRVCSEVGHFRYGATSDVVLLPGDGATAYLAATDGRILAVLPVSKEGELLGALLLPRELLDGQVDALVINEHAEAKRNKCTAAMLPLPPQEGRFPGIGAVVPKGDLSGHVAVTLDAALLWRLCRAVTTKDSSARKVTLFVPPAQQPGQSRGPVVVVGSDDESKNIGFGLIVPMSFRATTEECPEETYLERKRAFVAEHAARLPKEGVTFTKAEGR